MKIQHAISEITITLESSNLGSQRRRYLENYLDELVTYQTHHPDAVDVPSSLEIYCDSNPEAPECRQYDV